MSMEKTKSENRTILPVFEEKNYNTSTRLVLEYNFDIKNYNTIITGKPSYSCNRDL